MGSAVLAMDQYEVVDKLGFRYQITKLGASEFAAIIAGAQKRSNWVRCVDPLHKEHHVTEGGWQGAYNVRFIEISRTPFTYKTIRDARPASTVVHPQRRCTHSIRELTALYSSMIAADGNPNSYPNPNSHYGEHARVSKRALPLQL